jgi:hypothetical protein
VSLVPFSSDDDVLLTIDERVVSLLRESAEVARKENVAQARLADATKSFQVPEASDYSSGVCMLFPSAGGECVRTHGFETLVWVREMMVLLLAKNADGLKLSISAVSGALTVT